MCVTWVDDTARWRVQFKVGNKVQLFGSYVDYEKAKRREEQVKPWVEARRRKYYESRKPASGFRSPKNPWTLEEVEYVRANINLPAMELTKYLKRTTSSINGVKYRIKQGTL